MRPFFPVLLLVGCDVTSTVGFNTAALGTSSCSAKSSIAVCSAEPCVTTPIGAGQRGSWAIAVDDENVFFERIPTALAKVSIAGGAATDVRTDLDRIWMAAADAEYVYTTEFEAGVRRVKKAGGPSELVMHLAKGHPTAIALGSDDVYVTLTDENQIASAPKTGGQPTLLAGQPAPPAIATDDRYVYWVNQGANGGQNGELARAPLGDLTGAEVLLSGLESPSAIAVGEDLVFFAAGSKVFQVAKRGGDAEVVVDSFDQIKSLAAYGNTVYVAGFGGLALGRAGMATQVVDSRGMLGVAASCDGVFATGWFESFLVRYGR